MMFLSKAYNNQVVEPIQGNDLTRTSQHSPVEVQDHKTQGFPRIQPQQKSSILPFPRTSRTSQGATNYTSLKLTAKAQGKKNKHPKKKRIVFKVSISKVSTVSGYFSSHSPPPPVRTSQVAISIRPKYWPNIDPMHQ